MMKIPMKILAIIITMSALSVSAQNSAKEIFLEATEILGAQNIEMIMAIDVTDDKGRLKAKEMTVLLGEFGDEKKTKVVFQKPERAKGTTFIITELPGEVGVIDIFTPSNGKTRKLKATEANMKMMGAEFSMMSFANYNPEELNFEMLSDTVVNSQSCYQLKVSGSTVKDPSGAILVIGKDSKLIIETTRIDEKHVALTHTKLLDYEAIKTGSLEMYPMRIETKDFENSKDIIIRIKGFSVREGLTKSNFEL